jgi:hypothetical protein
MGPVAAGLLTTGISAVGSLFGQERANKANLAEAARNRQFQERMRNTQWQATVEDMRAAGINPAVAYSKGANAAPGGAQGRVDDSITPAINSALTAKRTMAELEQMKAATEKLKAEGSGAQAIADRETAKNAAYGLTRTPEGELRLDTSGDVMSQLLRRQILAEIEGREATGRRERLSGDIMEPMSGLSERFGEWLPILMLASKMAPGLLRAGGARLFSRPMVRETITRGPKGLTKSISRLRKSR